MTITNKKNHKLIVPYSLVSTMRAGVLTMGSLLGRYPQKKIKVALGGGCALGVRDTSWHLAGFKSLGVNNSLNKGYVNISSKNGLIGSKYKFPKVTVTGTSNLIMASVFVKGTHYIKNISIEPEVIDLINSNDRLFTVGRLDRDTTGAILVTNDGELANILMHPRNRIERIYFVLTKIDISRSKYNTLQKGIYLDDHAVAYGKIHRLGAENGFFQWKVILYEGKNHEVKRIFRALDSKVIHLHRYSFAGISIEHILPGKYRELKRNEIEGLLKLEQLSVKK